MASTSTYLEDKPKFWKDFPPVTDGKIQVIPFLEASSDIVNVLERLGTAFAPVRYDMQGNIDKVKRYLDKDPCHCLLEIMVKENEKGENVTAEGILWLNRALLFAELLFQEILLCLRSNNINQSMTKLFTFAYEGSVKRYHNWVAQQLFALICKMSPKLPQIFKSLGVDNLKHFEEFLASYIPKLSSVRSKIDEFFKENNLFV